MSKQVFWPLVAVVFGLIFLASNLRLLPDEFANLWPLMAIIVGLGGLVVSDRAEWIIPEKSSSKKMPAKAAPRRRR